MQSNNRGRKLILWPALACVLVGTAYFLQARRAVAEEKGAAVIRGTVRSSEGNSLYGILVKARGEGKNYATSVFTDGKGNYEFPPLPLGKYQVAVGTDWEESVPLGAAGATQNFSVQLGPGFMNQTTGAAWAKLIPGTAQEKAQLREGCSGGNCHTVWSLIQRGPESLDGWVRIVQRMGSVDLAGRPVKPGDDGYHMKLNAEELQTLAQFLAKNIHPGMMKEKYTAETMLRPTGEAARAVFTEWDLPHKLDYVTTATVDSHGIIWYAATASNAIGRLDPRTGKFQEWPYSTPNANFHDTLMDKEGNVWVTATYLNKVVKFDTKTYQYTDWTVEGKVGSNPHTADFDPDGNYWVSFTHATGGVGSIAKLDPRTGSVTEYRSPTKNPWPYGVAVDRKGNVWYNEFAGNKIGKIDRMGKLTLYTVPTPNSGNRRIQVDSKGRLWFTESNADKIGMLDPATGKISEYDPGIPGGLPYFVKVDKFDNIWFDLVNGHVLGKLDPQTKKFDYYLMPTPEGFPRDASFDYSTTPYAIVYGIATMPKIGRMYVR